MPRLTRNYILEPESDALKEARTALSEDEQLVYDFFVTQYNTLKLIPHRHTRTNHQRAHMYLIDSMDQWDDLEPQIEAEVTQFRFMSLDIEGFTPNPYDNKSKKRTDKVPEWKTKDRLTFVLVGTMAGSAVLFNMDRLANHCGASSYGKAARALPSIIRRFIIQEEIIICGSGVAEDVKKMDLPGNNLVDTVDVMTYIMSAHDGLTPLIDLGEATRPGMGTQCYYSRTYDMKPYTDDKYAELYGAHTYYDSDNEPYWPNFKRKMKLYQWPTYSDGKLREYCLFYLFCDATTPVAFVCRLAIDMLTQYRLTLDIDCTRAGAISALLNKFAVSVGGSLLPDISDSSDDEPLYVPMSTTPDRQAAPTSGIKPKVDVVHSDSDDDVLVLEASGDEQVPEVAPKVLPGSAFGWWTAAHKRNNPYKPQPYYGRVCHFCSSSGHSLNHKNGSLLCPKKRAADQNQEFCVYPPCPSKTTHTTRVCPRLHRLCRDCLHRGHPEGIGCLNWSEREWAYRRDLFERFAAHGLWTSTRRSEERYGWFGHLYGSPFPFPTNYDALVAMPVSKADTLLGLRPRPAQGFGLPYDDGNDGAGPPPPPPPPGPSRGSRPGRSSVRYNPVYYTKNNKSKHERKRF